MSRQSERRPVRLRLGSTLLLGGLVLAACSGSHEPAHSPGTTPLHGSIAPTTNVPALLGSSIAGLRQRLGPPQPLPAGFNDPVTSLSDRSHTIDSTEAFRTGGLLLVANYDAHSGQVHDLLLLGHHEDSLMHRATLQSNAANYLIMPVFYAGSHSKLLGLRIVATTN